ncbi:MAG: hypothetical protein JWO30_1121 [Fibrobacteres bacterium]|nr:hypothetical protein [Fibrobacterota bacterium]
MRIDFQDRQGILCGGNWIIDRVKITDRYPEREHLANILSESLHNGGAAYNVLSDLASLKAPFPLAGIGLVGEDEDGERILSHCRALAIDASGIRKVPGVKTSYTDVVSEKSTGKRTFFHSRGANARLDSEHFDLESSSARIFHLGYLLLLDKLDQVQEDGRTKAYHLLARARALGFKTSVDMVSAEGDGFAATVRSTLPAVDVLFLNEYEAEKTTGIGLRGEGLDSAAMREALEKLIEMGVREWVIIHSPAGACALSAQGEFLYQGSVKLPESRIAGTVGAGDAFAAGVLLGVHQDYAMSECLRLGVCAAAACLTHPGSSEGIASMNACREIGLQFGFRESSYLPQSLREKA